MQKLKWNKIWIHSFFFVRGGMDLLFTSEPRTDRLCCPRCVKSLKNACPLQISCEKKNITYYCCTLCCIGFECQVVTAWPRRPIKRTLCISQRVVWCSSKLMRSILLLLRSAYFTYEDLREFCWERVRPEPFSTGSTIIAVVSFGRNSNHHNQDKELSKQDNPTSWTPFRKSFNFSVLS